jgi:hypothetical protein
MPPVGFEPTISGLERAKTVRKHNISRKHGVFWRMVLILIPTCLTKHYVMKTYGGVDAYIQVFLIPVLVGVVSFTPLPLYPPGKEPPECVE